LGLIEWATISGVRERKVFVSTAELGFAARSSVHRDRSVRKNLEARYNVVKEESVGPDV